MSTKNEVLAALMREEAPISGERMARRLGVSRNSVWKAIAQLRDEGYAIDAATNRGYRLVRAPERLTEPAIAQWLRTRVFARGMEIHEQLDSTNTRAKALAAAGAPHGFLVATESQSGGRGRFGRTFYSPEHAGVYVTYVIRPNMSAERATMITSMAAVAVARAIEALAPVDVEIKWVNDLYIGPRKVCGILCEASMDFESGCLEYAVLGIGVNVASMDFPSELAEIATSIENACGVKVSRSRLVAEISNQLEALYPQPETGGFMEESRRRSNVIGREVLVLRGDERIPAKALAIDDLGRLVVESDAGILRLASGEISLKLRQ